MSLSEALQVLLDYAKEDLVCLNYDPKVDKTTKQKAIEVVEANINVIEEYEIVKKLHNDKTIIKQYKDQIKSIEIVLDLAKQNKLEEPVDEYLQNEMFKQEQAIDKIESDLCRLKEWVSKKHPINIC